jgi:hypothetical protein
VSTKSGEVGRKGEVGGREVSRRENFGGKEEAEKTKNSGQGRMCFWFIPKMASTASSSIGGCWFTPAIHRHLTTVHSNNKACEHLLKCEDLMKTT